MYSLHISRETEKKILVLVKLCIIIHCKYQNIIYNTYKNRQTITFIDANTRHNACCLLDNLL